MGGAGRSGDGLRMVSRVSVGGTGKSGDGLQMVSRVSLYRVCLLAGLVWEGLGCVGFAYKIVEIIVVSSDNGGGRVLGLLCVKQNGAGSNLAVHFDFFFSLSKVLAIYICA